MTKNHPGDKNGQKMEEPIGNAELACKPENAWLACKPENAGLACKPANVLGEESEQVLEEPGDNAKHGDLADKSAKDKNEPVLEEPGETAKHGDLAYMPANEEERVTMEDLTDEEGGHVEDMDKEQRTKKKIKGRGVVQGKAVKICGNYDKEIAAHKENKIKEMIERDKSIEKAARKEKSWELMRELKKIIRENRGQWKENEELRGRKERR